MENKTITAIKNTKYFSLAEKLLFLKKFLKNPQQVGSILPSSRFLAQSISKHVLRKKDHIVVELGAGTGALTQHLLEIGLDNTTLVLVEKDKIFVNLLKNKFPSLTVIHGDALKLTTLIEQHDFKVSTVVSSLPMNALAKEDTKKIITQIADVLPESGKYIQYHYLGLNFKSKKDLFSEYFSPIEKEMIWGNLPPAVISVFCKICAPSEQGTQPRYTHSE